MHIEINIKLYFVFSMDGLSLYAFNDPTRQWGFSVTHVLPSVRLHIITLIPQRTYNNDVSVSDQNCMKIRHVG